MRNILFLGLLFCISCGIIGCQSLNLPKLDDETFNRLLNLAEEIVELQKDEDTDDFSVFEQIMLEELEKQLTTLDLSDAEREEIMAAIKTGNEDKIKKVLQEILADRIKEE